MAQVGLTGIIGAYVLTSPLKQRGEVFLLAGLVLLAAAFVPFVPILWLIAQVTIGPAALVLLIASAWRARDAAAPVRQQAFGLVLLLSALTALYGASLATMIVANQIFPPRKVATVVTLDQWARTLAIWLVAAILSALGLRRWTNWPWRRCLAWGAVVFSVPLAELFGFWLILQTNPVRTA